MYFLLDCPDPPDGEQALLAHRSDSPRRRWRVGSRFANPPPLPVVATVDKAGALIEYWDVPVPLMTQRLARALQGAGVSNIDFYPAEIHDPATATVNRDYVAFNIIGKIAAADMERSVFEAPEGGLVAVHFDTLVIDSARALEVPVFRLAESTSGIVVHHTIKTAIEAAGIDTLEFLAPEEWVS